MRPPATSDFTTRVQGRVEGVRKEEQPGERAGLPRPPGCLQLQVGMPARPDCRAGRRTCYLAVKLADATGLATYFDAMATASIVSDTLILIGPVYLVDFAVGVVLFVV